MQAGPSGRTAAMIRSAGILIPDGAGERAISAGFGQIEAQVMKVGMVAEAACISKPMDGHAMLEN